MNASILAGLSQSERAELHLPPSILRRLEDEDRDRSWYDPETRRSDAWWLYVQASRRVGEVEREKQAISRQAGAVLADNARLLAEVAALRAQFLGDSTHGGAK